MPKSIDNILTEELIERKLISKEELVDILKEVEKTGNLKDVLIKRKIVSEEDILNIFSEKLKLQIVNLNKISPDKSVIDKISAKIASYYKFIPLSIKDRVLTIAVASPLELKIQDEIRTQIGFDISVVLCSEKELNETFRKFYGLAADTLEGITSFTAGSGNKIDIREDKIEDIEKVATDASIIKLVNQIILDAYRKRATDIHIEPYRGGVEFRYRIDGILYDVNIANQVKNVLNAIISRIKIMSGLNIVERRLPQDGRAIVRVQNEVLDLRISTIPTPFGESVVIRILPAKMLFSLERLGLSRVDLQIFEKLIQLPYGIIFVTGPTGSGKTTTLYACLNRINTRDKKIITIEDPIEYEIPNITQIQVMPEIGLDFATGLKHILRHDPDVIMVGEVRDLETAEISIRVALTGHLVFSTLHTNDAASGITRLIDIGVEPYLVSSTVQAFIAQRLVRLICENCKYEDENVPLKLKELIKEDLGFKSINEVRVFNARGCSVCNFTGFLGRTALYEILVINEKLQALILEKAPAHQIKKVAILNGMRTLRQDGWHKVISGITTPQEVMKVTFAAEAKKEESKVIIPSVEVSEIKSEDFTKFTSVEEKRVYNRLEKRVNIKYKVIDLDKDLVKFRVKYEQLTISKNISAGGLLFITYEKLPIGSILELKIELPDGNEPIDCLAKVVRIEEVEYEKIYNIAVCFLDISGAQRSRLNKFIETS